MKDLLSITPKEVDYSNVEPQTDLIQEVYQKSIKSIIDKKEELIKEAISHALNRTDWKIEELKGRCSVEILQNTREEYYCIDGKRMIIFMPPDFQMEDAKFTMVLNYKELYKSSTSTKSI